MMFGKLRLLGKLKRFPGVLHERSLHNELMQSKLALIDAEISLGRLVEPANHPGNIEKINPSFYDYLSYVHETKRYRKLTWLDLGYRRRSEAIQDYVAQSVGKHLPEQQAFVDIHEASHNSQQAFDGVKASSDSSLMLPVIEYELERLFRRQQLSHIPFNTNIIFDITFDDYMSSLEAKNLAEQLLRIIYFNKTGNNRFLESSKAQPFNIHLAGLSKSDKTRGFLEYFFNDSIQKFFPSVFLHEEDLTKIFPKDKLVYMSPHSDTVLEEFDPECAYVIGGIVDRREIIELTPQKIRDLGLRSARLPTSAIHGNNVQSLHDVFKILYSLQSCPEVNHETVADLTNKILPKRAN